MMKSRNLLTVIQINDSHAYFDLHQEMLWQGGQAVSRRAGGLPALPTFDVVEGFVPYSSL